MIKQVLVLNGPNLGRLGIREPEIYGSATFEDLADLCRATGRKLGLSVEVRQTDDEGEMIGWVHEAADARLPVVLNPAAFTHTSVAILDALNAYDGPVIEVHISNVHKREAFRHHSFVSTRADGVIAGFGTQGYQLALRRIARLIDENQA